MKKHLFLIAILLVLASVSTAIAEAEAPQANVLNSVNAQPLPTVSLDLKDTPVKDALDTLFKGSGLNYAVEPGINAVIVNLTLHDVPFDKALEYLAKSVGITYRNENGVYIFSPREIAVMAPIGGYAAPNSPGVMNILPTDGSDKAFDIFLDHADLYKALKELLDVSGHDYLMDVGATPQFSGPIVTASIKGVQLERALSLLLKSSNLTMQKENDVYIISTQDYGRGYGARSNQQAAAPGSNVTTIPCPKCGKPILKDWKYCSQCGVMVAPPSAPKGKSK